MWYIMVKAKIMPNFNGNMTAVTKKHAHGKNIYKSISPIDFRKPLEIPHYYF